MKQLFPFLLFFLISFQSTAQYSKYLVQLKDKAQSSYSLSNPSQFLSQRAIQRRIKFNLQIDSTDLPVSAKYLDSIRNTGAVTILNSSKWLNQVLIQTTDQNALSKIQSFSFVRAAKTIGLKATGIPVQNKMKEPVVEAKTPEVNREAETAGNVFDYGNNYQQVHIHEGEFLHNKGFRGENIQIAVLDAGFRDYKTITAFDSIRINNQVLGERDFVAFDNSVNEDDAHGMNCLSILSANWPGKMVGTAPKAKYWLIRTENAPTEYPIEEYNWVVGAEFADSTGTDLITTSLGYTTFDDPSFDHTYNDLYKNTAISSQGAEMAVRKGMIVTASAGNEGNGSWKYISFPADADSVCTVGAINNAGQIASFSSYGYPGKVKPNIVSVGVSTVIAGLNNQPTTGNGTSFSNPNVAGLIACLWQAFPNANNIEILNAVYKSADKYGTPDNRYGYGIPNFRIAYQQLKRDENFALYGSSWLFATPTPFNNDLQVKFIGQVDGPVTISLVNSAGQVIATQNFVSEKEEVYTHIFTNLSTLPAGFYTVRYSDSATTRTISVQRGNIFEKEWLVALPNPFANELSVFIKGQETAEVKLRLVNTNGGVVETITAQVTQGESTSVRFQNAQNLSQGVYFLQYIGKSQKRTLRLFKG